MSAVVQVTLQDYKDLVRIAKDAGLQIFVEYWTGYEMNLWFSTTSTSGGTWVSIFKAKISVEELAELDRDEQLPNGRVIRAWVRVTSPERQ